MRLSRLSLVSLLLPLFAQAAQPVFRIGEHGLWRLRFADGTHLSAADCETNAALKAGCVRERGPDGETILRWKAPAAEVTVRRVRQADGSSDLVGTVVPLNAAVVGFALPARLRFPAVSVRRFVYPGGGSTGLGLAFNGRFFTEPREYRMRYPSLFADFAYLETTNGATAAVYGVQPRPPHEPWSGSGRLFVPGETGVGADAAGGWYDHAFAPWARAGEAWTAPTVRIRLGRSLEAALDGYAADNRLTRTLEEKVRDPAVLRKLKEAPLFLVYGPAKEKISALEKMPVPTHLHFCDYLKGGFDKEYPDHLPPHPTLFGPPEMMTAWIGAAHAKGHLVSPYTNPTWWCDNPRGPTFAACGDAPLARDARGEPYREGYAAGKTGFLACPWHPDVRRANRTTVRRFTRDYPVDLVFQDQCGGRSWKGDFNPAAPDPSAWADGILEMLEEDSADVPLATEHGWDQVVNLEAVVTGCTGLLVPTEKRTTSLPWRLDKERFPADTWTVEPVATRLFHGKALFYLHDLMAAVTDERLLAWVLALGYNISYVHGAKSFTEYWPHANWYAWIHLIQSRVLSRVAGRPLVAFRHDRAPLLARGGDPARPEDDGVVLAQYGELRFAVNLGDVPRKVDGHRLAPYGWWIEGPGVKAGRPEDGLPFVETEDGRWTYDGKVKDERKVRK